MAYSSSPVTAGFTSCCGNCVSQGNCGSIAKFLSVVAAVSQNAEVGEEAFDDVDYTVVALRVGWAEEESRIGDEGKGIMHDAFGDLAVSKANFGPEPLDLGIALKKL